MQGTPFIIQYAGAFTGDNFEIRTLRREDGEFLVSLHDILTVLRRENKKIDASQRHTPTDILQAVIKSLDPDEVEHVACKGDPPGLRQPFVTEPGLFRVVSRDDSPACRKFQRWLFHEVLPSIHKYGYYPPPSNLAGSDIRAISAALIQHMQTMHSELIRREEFERQVRSQFHLTDERMREIDTRLSRMEQGAATLFFDVEKECQNRGLDVDPYAVFAWCFKLAFQYGIEARVSNQAYQGLLFSMPLIEEAILIVSGMKTASPSPLL